MKTKYSFDLSLLVKGDFREFDKYIMELQEKNEYNREIIIALTLWLDYENFTWNEHSIKVLKKYLEKYPNDIFCFVLYAVNSFWVGELAQNTSIKKIKSLKKECGNDRYNAMLTFLEIIWYENIYKKMDYLTKDSYIKLIKKWGQEDPRSINPFKKMGEIYHMKNDWNNALNMIDKIHKNYKGPFVLDSPLKIISEKNFINTHIRGMYSVTNSWINNLRKKIIDKSVYNSDYWM